jgi:long-chain acyl-CoA synthetase
MVEPDDIETHYRQSAFIEEICVLGRHAVVVPNMALIRKKQIVNVGDILRFEMEGLQIGLASHQYVSSYDVWFEPLPRTAAGEIERHEVERIVRERRRAAEAPLAAADQEWLGDAHATAAVAAMLPRLRAGARIGPDANLEIDLGLDSVDRVELLAELEHRFGIRVPATTASEIFTVRQLVDAVRPIDKPKGLSPREDVSWAAMLEDLPRDTDPVLSGLLERKPFATPLLYAATRVLRLLCRVSVSGLEHVPARGPFLVCPNHQSYLDPLFVCGALPYAVFRRLFFIGAVEYFETALTKWVARTVNLLPVDPDSNLLPAMKACAFGLRHGKVLLLFPEGERSIDGTVKKFKKGAPILARHLGVPIVPVALKGIYELWPRNRALQWSVLWPWSGHRVTVVFGPPLTFGGSESHSQAAVRLRDRVDEMWRAKG